MIIPLQIPIKQKYVAAKTKEILKCFVVASLCIGTECPISGGEARALSRTSLN